MLFMIVFTVIVVAVTYFASYNHTIKDSAPHGSDLFTPKTVTINKENVDRNRYEHPYKWDAWADYLNEVWPWYEEDDDDEWDEVSSHEPMRPRAGYRCDQDYADAPRGEMRYVRSYRGEQKYKAKK